MNNNMEIKDETEPLDSSSFDRREFLDAYCERMICTLLSIKGIRTVAYMRIEPSDNHKNMVNCYNDQLSAVKKAYNDHENWWLVDRYFEIAHSGTNAGNRSEFLRLINDARRGHFDLVVASDINRFSCQVDNAMALIEILHNYGVKVYFINDDTLV